MKDAKRDMGKRHDSFSFYKDVPSTSLSRGEDILQSVLDRLGINNLESHDSQTETAIGE